MKPEKIPVVKALLTCHNRVSYTLDCLHLLFNQSGIGESFSLQVFLVDDKSPDNTTALVSSRFPDVHIIEGTGDLFWNRGMIRAWAAAAKDTETDYFLWINDDTHLFPGAIMSLLKTETARPGSIVCGSTVSKGRNKTTYGGYTNEHKKLIEPTDEAQSCDYFNGNCVLVPQTVFEIVGSLRPEFHHSLGDFDYGLRARKLGVLCLVAPGYAGTCEEHDELPKCFNPRVRLRQRLEFLYRSSSWINPDQYFTFEARHYGIGKAIFHYASIHLRVLVPSLWKSRTKFF